MRSKIALPLIVLTLTLDPAISARAFQGGGGGGVPGGPGFTGSPGGGFTGPRGGGFTDSLGGFRGGDDGVGLNILQALRRRRSGTSLLSGTVSGNAYRSNRAMNLKRGNAINNVNRAIATRNVNLIGWALSPWLYGPMLYHYGYSSYFNPYFGGSTVVPQQPVRYDYSRPIDAQSTPPPGAVTDQALSQFDAARYAFKRGDYSGALELVDQALKSTPDDPTVHEFRALDLFALERFDEAAAALYAVLSVEPGWDRATLISLYGDPARYTEQLRALQAFSTQNPRSAQAHFLLAYHFLTQGHAEAAVRRFKLATSLQPRDTLSAQLIEQLEHLRQRVAATGVAGPEAPAAPSAQTLTDTAPAGKKRTIEGTWRARPSDDRDITVTFQDSGRFTWKVNRQGKDQQFQGKFDDQNGIVTLVQDQNHNTVLSNLRWTDETHFVFKVMGAGPGDRGLSFTKSP